MPTLSNDIGAFCTRQIAALGGWNLPIHPLAATAIGRRILATLDPRLQQIFVWHYLQGHDVRAIAGALNCKMLDVEKACSAAMNHFAIHLEAMSKPAARDEPPFADFNSSQQSFAEKWRSRFKRPRCDARTAIPATSMSLQTAYETLGISRSDSPAVRRIAYLKAIKKFHPDMVFTRGPKAKTHADTMSKLINQAWSLIRDDCTAQ